MKKALFILIVGLFTFNVYGQAKEETKKEKRAKRWQKEKEELLELARDSAFVLDAHAHFDRYQNQRQLASNNFIAINGDEIIIQTSNPFGSIGYNGLGGITLQGNIQSYNIREGKKKHGPSIQINFSNGVIGNGTLFIDLNSKENATARLTDNWGNRNTWQGKVLEPDEIMNFTGMSFR